MLESHATINLSVVFICVYQLWAFSAEKLVKYHSSFVNEFGRVY